MHEQDSNFHRRKQFKTYTQQAHFSSKASWNLSIEKPLVKDGSRLKAKWAQIVSKRHGLILKQMLNPTFSLTTMILKQMLDPTFYLIIPVMGHAAVKYGPKRTHECA